MSASTKPTQAEVDSLAYVLGRYTNVAAPTAEELCRKAASMLRALSAPEVPREPTEAMMQAGVAQFSIKFAGPIAWQIQSVWRAMYDAAPSAATLTVTPAASEAATPGVREAHPQPHATAGTPPAAPAPAATGYDAELCRELVGLCHSALVSNPSTWGRADFAKLFRAVNRAAARIEALAAEVARIKRDADESNRILGDECERLRARAEAAEKDAARYRWLRDDARREDGPIWCVTWRHGWPNDPRSETDDLHASALDRAIDAAIASAKKGAK